MPEDVRYINIFNLPTELFTMISIEAHRASIGRFYGKSKIRNKVKPLNGIAINIFLLIVTLMSLVVYGSFVAFIYTFSNF